jgi:hypothetical protein
VSRPGIAVTPRVPAAPAHRLDPGLNRREA